ncbi:MAG TPA: PilX N-terminal domain-containing pilus assembly protein [Steroidobacteraceae bacterium]|nr:PilX N-terminal domain-containing pilus assembly protein [Steroidobacteraceae bacterium]
MCATTYRRPAERGVVLITSLLLLLIVTIMAVSMFRSFGIEEKIVSNLREKHRALQAAETAQQYAEWWITQAANISNVQVCNAVSVATGNVSVGQICANPLPTVVTGSVATIPWTIGGVPVGTDYAPPTMTVNTTSATGTYYAPPRFYISLLGASATGLGNVYQIDAYGYGGTPNAAAVVESTYLVSTSVKCVSCSP